MANQIKGLGLIVLLVAAGAVILFLSLGQGKPKEQDAVVLQEVLKQTPADPIPALAIVTSPQDGLEAGFTIQVYSFQDKKRAEVALENLKGEGYKAFMIISDLGEKGIWYRVRVGGIADDTQAKLILDKIRKSYNSGFIVKPEK